MYFPQNTEDEEGLDYLLGSLVNDKHYEWQLFIGNQWLRIDNDLVIETHYCQPGAKGITISTKYGPVSIDFDNLQTSNAGVHVQRLSFPPQGQTEDVGWYFRDELAWREYGSQNSSMEAPSINSRYVERQFALNPQGSFRFTMGSTDYVLDFFNMRQTNCTTGTCRNVRRRPKFTSNTQSLPSTSLLPTASSLQPTDGGYKWEFMGEEGEWTEYQAHKCSFDSAAIERQYQLNPQGLLHFRIRRYTYYLDFSRMEQVNEQVRTRRAVRRTANNGIQHNSSWGTQPQWQFQDADGIWKDYSKGHQQCSMSSQDIELQYQQNPSGTVMFTTRIFTYELDFLVMTQRNLSTNTIKPVRRLNQ